MNRIDSQAETHARHRANWQRLAEGAATRTIAGDGVTIENTGSALRVKDLGIGTAKIAAGAVTTAKLATVNANVGTFNNCTVNAQGQVTAASNVAYLTGNQVVTLSGDASGSGATAINVTLATVNSNVGTFNNVTVNAKGLVTGASNIAYLTGNQNIAVSGDASGSGTTAIALTLATVNSNVGTFNNVTVNGKGLVTAASNVSYLTGNQNIAVSGDASGSGTTAIALTLATVNSNVGTFNNVTVTGKGLVTAASNVAYLTGNQTVTLSGDASGSGATAVAVTLATVNSNVGTFNNVTVNGKGLVTAASNVAYLTGNQTITFSGDITGTGSTAVAATIANGVVSLAKLGALTTKGDVLTFSTTHARQGVGSDEQVLVADSAQTTGLKWAERARLLSSNTANSAAIANTLTETNFDKSFTLPANFFTAGRVIRLTAWGQYSASLTPALTLRVKVGTGLTLVPTSQGVFNNAANRTWRVDATIHCTSTGASGSLRGNSEGNIQDASNLITMNAATGTVDTTGTLAVVVSAQWGTAAAANTLFLQSFILEALN